MIGWIFNSLSRRATLWVKEWNQTSIDRKRLSYPAIERLLRRAGERPFLFVALIWLTAVCLSIGLGWAAPKYLGLCKLIPSEWKEAELLTYFGTLWTLQGTIAALVYPIVIAFVAVLLQRRATAKLSLRLYALDAAVVPAGSSAIALLIWMGLEYVSISYVPTEWLVVAMVGNSVWFVLNLLLTGWFLYRTVRFLNDQERLLVFTRFAVHVAFPREVRVHLLGLIFSNAQTHKFIPGKDFINDEPGPKVLLYPMSLGVPCVTVRRCREQAITDIRLRLLAWGVSLWLRQEEDTKVAPSISGMNPQDPLLEIPIAPGETVEGEVVLCRVRDGKSPGPVASFFIRHSVVFGPPPRPDTSYSSSEIMEELAVEALTLAEQKRFEAATETVLGLADLHADLIRSGAYINDNREHDNAALLPAPYGFGSQRIHEGWLKVYRQIAEMAVRELSLDSTLYRRYCYLAYRIVGTLKDQHLDILVYILHLSTYLMYRLGSWWANRVEEHGLVTHDAFQAVVLPLPLGGTYDRALQAFIEGWEAIRLRERDEQPSNADEAWANHSRQARFAAALAEQTARMLLGAVVRGDKAAALWLADSFLKWWERHQHYFDRYPNYGLQNPLLTFACVGKKWFEVRNILDAVPEGQQELMLTGEVISTVLRRYWTDLRFVLILILLDWTPGSAPQDAFTLELAIALLQGRNLKHGSRVDADALTNPRNILFRLIRLQLADRDYEQTLDKLVDYAQELRRPGMVAGRIYSWSGANDVESLYLAQNQVLLAITNAAIDRFPELKGATSKWSKDLQQLDRCKRLAQKLAECTASEELSEKSAVTAAMRKAIGLPDNLDGAREWICAALQDLANLAEKTHDETLKNAQVSQRCLDEIGKTVTDYLLGSDNNVFPFTLASELEQVSDAMEPRSLSISGVGKEPYTDPPLDTESSSFRNWFNEHVAEAVAVGVISEYIKTTDTKPLRSDSERAFFEELTMRAELLRKVGLTPILVISEHNNLEWLSPWRYQTGRAERSDEVSFQSPKTADTVSLIGYFNEVPTYRAPIVRNHCYVVPKEHFKKIHYNTFVIGSCISVTATPEAGHKICLTFEWRFRTDSGIRHRKPEGSQLQESKEGPVGGT